MAGVLLRVWKNGGRFDSWSEHFRFDNWLRAFEQEGLELDFYAARARALDELLPWDTVDCGVSKSYHQGGISAFSSGADNARLQKGLHRLRYESIGGREMSVRAVVKFSKGEGVKYISHLDVLRLFQRAALRAELPVSYSQGYNPHMLIGFACALPVGVISSAEYMELKLAQEIAEEKLSDRLNAVLPAGIAVLRVKAVPEAGRRLRR